jgi:hypothetical protein
MKIRKSRTEKVLYHLLNEMYFFVEPKNQKKMFDKITFFQNTVCCMQNSMNSQMDQVLYYLTGDVLMRLFCPVNSLVVGGNLWLILLSKS